MAPFAENLPNIDFFVPYIRFFSILLIPIGALLLFYGYKLFKFFIAFTGFIFGFGFGAAIVAVSDQIVFIGILGGILGALIFYGLYKLGIFFLGMILCGFLGLILMAMAEEMQPALLLIFAVGGGIFALFIEKAIIIFFSSYQGASLVIGGLTWIFIPEYQIQIMAQIFTDIEAYISYLSTQIILTLILTVIGILYQYGKIPRKLDPILPTSIKRKISGRVPDKESVNTGMEIKSNDKTKKKWTSIQTAKSNNSSKLFNKQILTKTIDRRYLRRQKRGKVRESDYKTPLPERNSPDDKQREVTTGNLSSKHLFKFPFKLNLLNGFDNNELAIVGYNKGKYYSATIGRGNYNKKNHIHLSDPEQFISRKHAEFAWRNGRGYVRCSSDTNPLWLNHKKVDQNIFQPVNIGDILKMVKIRLKIVK